MYQVLVIVQVVLAIGVIGLVLMQHGKGADAGAAFGSGASGTVFGSRGSANFLSRGTAVLAALFFLVSLTLAVIIARGGGEQRSLADQLADEPAASMPLDVPPEMAPADAVPPSEAPE